MRMQPLLVSVCVGVCGAVAFGVLLNSAPLLVYTASPVSPEVPSEISPRISVEIPEISPQALTDSFYRGPWKQATATVFWSGEEAGEDNGFIHNNSSAWDIDWETSFGGEDDPTDRCEYHPCAFTPKENPFYIALPYSDMHHGTRKENTRLIPWNDPNVTSTLIKNRWIEVRSGVLSCFGQWEDVGPFETDDAAYVFGTAENPANTRGAGAGIDLSPAMRDCLRIGGVAEVEWRHVDEEVVPEGPWTQIITGE